MLQPDGRTHNYLKHVLFKCISLSSGLMSMYTSVLVYNGLQGLFG